ncbi:NAD-dependent epimerase/dehydratase family protein [Nakamurella multipartita]|uniref:NAD-dependent epimerase/dehydratase n=1 Tax=Nakamurella multipartita (strain ATCC 700099 / DSM 44233 / CIP 104796 / JCM 9543 / NBRC 105858 / Y-104) TaxID=479431 RepID=C8XIM2_NAKMY|nr:NAD-dependent epimerase/dehydratase family protein [Nakamurella multipartita]ACV80487.1 NAD-dependent epimerase/dehydratase [Nakamurella multipartita DSM 44233]
MTTSCLITGGAGFIGCAVSRILPDRFDRVVAIDNLHPQIHPTRHRPADLDERVEFVRGDVTSADDWDDLLAQVRPTVIIHLAAETGTGQSLTEASRHAKVNVVGTTEMLDAFVRHSALPDRIVLASSRAVYGEGAWADPDGRLVYPGQRPRAMLEAGTWDFPGLTATPFNSHRVQPSPTSIYGSTKLAQEHIVRSWSLAMNVTPVLFRLQNVYGPGQSLINPYTGIVSLFTQKAKAREVIPVFEDGAIIRDFVFIDDVASALVAGTGVHQPDTEPYDVGSGEATSILGLAQVVAAHYGAPAPEVNGRFRDGDVRHASCTIQETRRDLDWTPRIMLPEGVRRLCDWIDRTDGRTF